MGLRGHDLQCFVGHRVFRVFRFVQVCPAGLNRFGGSDRVFRKKSVVGLRGHDLQCFVGNVVFRFVQGSGSSSRAEQVWRV